MKRNVSSIFWGLLFILAGAALLADRMGWINFSLVSTNTWVYIFAALSLVFFLSYFLNGLRQWGWLFPALILGAISLTIWMADRGLTGSYMGMPILLSIAIPFYVGFAFDRKAWGLLIPAWVMTVLAFITLTADLVDGHLIGALFLYAVAAPFLVVYLLNRSRWWALIPAWVTFILGTITLLSDHVDGNLIGALFLYAVALPFLVVYLMDRTRRWALIPAAALPWSGPSRCLPPSPAATGWARPSCCSSRPPSSSSFSAGRSTGGRSSRPACSPPSEWWSSWGCSSRRTSRSSKAF